MIDLIEIHVRFRLSSKRSNYLYCTQFSIYAIVAHLVLECIYFALVLQFIIIGCLFLDTLMIETYFHSSLQVFCNRVRLR